VRQPFSRVFQRVVRSRDASRDDGRHRRRGRLSRRRTRVVVNVVRTIARSLDRSTAGACRVVRLRVDARSNIISRFTTRQTRVCTRVVVGLRRRRASIGACPKSQVISISITQKISTHRSIDRSIDIDIHRSFHRSIDPSIHRSISTHRLFSLVHSKIHHSLRCGFDGQGKGKEKGGLITHERVGGSRSIVRVFLPRAPPCLCVDRSIDRTPSACNLTFRSNDRTIERVDDVRHTPPPTSEWSSSGRYRRSLKRASSRGGRTNGGRW